MTQNMINKDIIFSHTTAENIYLKYLNLTSFPKNNISSPFSDDNNPSFKLYPNGTFKCNSSGKQGDVLQFVAYMEQLDNKTEFKEVLQRIATKMNIIAQPVSANTNNHPKSNKTHLNAIEESLQPVTKMVATEPNILLNTTQNHSKNGTNDVATEPKPVATINNKKEQPAAPKKLIISIRDFSKLDLEYWRNLGVEKTILDKFKVHSISESGFEYIKMFKTQPNTISFAYEIDGLFKKYTPEQPEYNVKKSLIPHLNNVVFGLEQLPTEKIENLIICEGEKDVIVASSRGFNAVTFGSATNNPTTENIKRLQEHCNNLFVCYDADPGGETGAKNMIKNYPEIINLQLPKNNNIKGYDITDYFQECTAQDFQKIIDLAVKNKKIVEVTEENENTDLTIFHKTENYLLKNYDIRFDIIANEFEMSKKDMNVWGELNDSSLYVEMQKKHLKISQGNLTAILSSDFVQKFNPLKEYFEGLHSWDKRTDYIKQFLDYVELEAGEDKEQFIYHFKKWCVRSVKCSIIEGYFNKQAFVLSDDAKGQSIGKTTFIRYLVPKALNKYYCENLPDDKDALKRLGQNFIINLDELATLSRTDINKLKSMFSSDNIKTRLPYGKKDIVISRVANFIGSTNMSTFLVDESGSVRWLCFIVKKINFNYSLEFNIDNLWSQAYALSKDESFNEAMTIEDIRKNEIRNDKFQILTPERELIPKYFEVPTSNEYIDHLTSTEILHHISLYTSGVRLTAGAIGKAMPRCGFIRKKNKKGIWGYWVIKKPTS